MSEYKVFYEKKINELINIIDDEKNKVILIRGERNSGTTTIIKALYSRFEGSKLFLTGTEPMFNKIYINRIKRAIEDYFENNHPKFTIFSDEFYSDELFSFINNDCYDIQLVVTHKSLKSLGIKLSFIFKTCIFKQKLLSIIKYSDISSENLKRVSSLSTMNLIDFQNSLDKDKQLAYNIDFKKYGLIDTEVVSRKTNSNTFKIFSSYQDFTIIETVVFRRMNNG